MDTALLEALAHSLAPAAAGGPSQGGGGGSPGGAAPPPPPASWDPAPLREYVVATFVRRGLTAACMRHAAYERTGVNCVRLAAALAGQPSVRSVTALAPTLAPLLRPLLDVLAPPDGADPSLGTKEAAYRCCTGGRGGREPRHPFEVQPEKDRFIRQLR